MKKSQIVITIICYIIFIMIWLICGFYGFICVLFSNVMPSSVKIIFVVLAFAIIVYPIFGKQKNPKCAYIAIILTISVVFLFCLSYYGFFKYYSDFTPQKWNSVNQDLRQYMIDSLEKKYNIIGMKQEEVTGLLGTPDYSQDSEYRPDDYQRCYYEYIINYAMIDPVMYRINFENGTAIFTEIKIYN